MNALGIHLLIEMQDCSPISLDDIDHVRNAMLTAARETGVTVLGDKFHKFSPQGVTGVVAIAESHLTIHTWPEYKYAAADVFTCGDSFDPRIAAAVLVRELNCKKPQITEIKRGLSIGFRPSKTQMQTQVPVLAASKGYRGE